METFQQDWADRHLMGLWQVTPWQLKFNSLFMGELQSKHKCHCHSIKWIFEVKTTTVQHTVKNSNNFVHISARHLEELFWIYFPASSLRLVAPTPAWHLGSSQVSREIMVSKRGWLGRAQPQTCELPRMKLSTESAIYLQDFLNLSSAQESAGSNHILQPSIY